MNGVVLCQTPVWVQANHDEPCKQPAGHKGPHDQNRTIDPDSVVSDYEYGRRMALADRRDGRIRADARSVGDFMRMPTGWQVGYSWGYAHPEEEPGV